MDATASSAVASAAAGLVLGQITFLPSWPSLGWLVILALSAQVVGYLLISVALPRLPSALTSIVLLIQPVAAVGLAMLILGESPSPMQPLGVGLVVGGVVLATARAPRGRQAAVAEAAEGPRRVGYRSRDDRRAAAADRDRAAVDGQVHAAEPPATLSPWAVVVRHGRVAWVGSPDAAPATDRWEDLGSALVTPGLVDAHTHPVFAGDRSDEAAARLSGQPYEAGGILRTVASTRAASDDALEALVEERSPRARHRHHDHRGEVGLRAHARR